MGEAELEKLLLDADGIEEIEAALGSFNIFEAIGQFRREELHSNFLAFFLDPNKSHGLGTEFLSRFVVELIKAQKSDTQRISLSEVAVMDFEKTRIYREYGLAEHGRIDLLCVNEPFRFFLAIENKIDAGEGSRQLKNYRNALLKKYVGYRYVFAFLTSDGRKPCDDKWMPVSYEIVHSIALAIIDKSKRGMDEEVTAALDHYASMLRRHIVGDDKLEEIALTFYRKHMKAIDYVSNLIPDVQVEAMNRVDNLISKFGKENDIAIVRKTKTLINFAPMSWRNIFCSKLKEKWTSSDYSLLFEIQVKATIINLRLFVGPMEDTELRNKIFYFAKKNSEIFGDSLSSSDSKYSYIYSKILVDNSILYERDMEKISNAFQINFEEFFGHDFEKIVNSLIHEFGNCDAA